MKIVIIGGGKVGYTIASRCIDDGHDVTIVDSSRRAVERMSDSLDGMVLLGSGAELTSQRAAKVGQSDLLVAATPHDETNILCCMLARKLGCANTIARVRNREYKDELYLLRSELGLSMAVNPDASAAREIFRLLQFPGLQKRELFVKSRVEIVAAVLKEDSPLCGKKLMELPRVLHQRVLVCAVQRGGEVIIPSGAFELCAEDEVYITAPTAELPRLLESMGIRRRRARNVMIVGGSRVAVVLSELLCSAGVRVKLIESDAARCRELAELLPEVSVVCADGTSQDVLKSENIAGMDAVVSLTDTDEENVFISMFANLIGVPQAITKVNRSEYRDICRSCGIEYAVSPREICAGEVNRYIRAMQSTNAESMLSLYRLLDGKAEALEFEVTADVPHLGEKLSALRLRDGILLACISREGRVIFPGGGDALLAGDVVIVITSHCGTVLSLGDIFADRDGAV